MIGAAHRDGFSTVTPYVIVSDADAFFAFASQAFAATETYRMEGEQGGTHVELAIGNSKIMVGESEQAATPAYLFLYVDEAEVVYSAAIEAGATEMMPLRNGRFSEEVGGAVTDPFGNGWFIAQHGPRSSTP